MAHYAGNDPLASNMVWLDSMFGMGVNMYELVPGMRLLRLPNLFEAYTHQAPGYDCPSYATFLATTFHQEDSSITRNNSICIFEYTADHPIQRHTFASHVTVSRNSYLVVRSVSTVGNYDYTIDYVFHLDGTIEVKVRASGYIFGAYQQLEAAVHAHNDKHERSDDEYGYQIHDVVAGSMHDHVINFKADLDIAGTSNTLSRVSIAPITKRYCWHDSPRNTMHLTHSSIEIETGLNWLPNAGAMYVVLNDDSSNAWGERRGYRITPGTGMGSPPHLTIENSTTLGKTALWSTHDLWVLRAKDVERRSASEYNAMEPHDPILDFAKMVDGEDIVQEDL